MTSFLIKCFVKEDDTNLRRKKIGFLAGWVNVICNIVLFVVKLLVGTFLGSLAVTADAFNNLSDCGSSFVTLAGFKIASRSPNKKHPYGYGRIEYITGMIIAILILMVGLEFITSSIDQIINPEPVSFNWAMLILLLLAMAVKLWMGFANSRFGKEMGGSSAMSATAFDSLADVAVTAVSVLSIVLSQFVSFPIDGYLGILIALFVIFGGVKILIDAIRPLLGQRPDPEMVENIKKIVISHDQIVGVHDMMVHNYGPTRTIVTLHAEVPATNDIMYAHEVIDHIEMELSEEMGITLIIHMDPIVTDDERLNEIKELTKKCVKEISPSYSIHDFRMLDGKHRINLIFDVLTPYEDQKSDEQIIEEITKVLKEKDERFNPKITIDKSYV